MKTTVLGAITSLAMIALPASSANAQSEHWAWVSPSPTGANLYDVDFASPTIAVAVGSGGDIVRSEDGGATWEQLVSPSLETLYALDFNGTKGIAAGANGTILISFDSGATWEPRTSGITATLNGACMVSPSNAVVVGDAGTILQSLNGGPWIPRSGGTGLKLFAVDFADGLHGIIIGVSKKVLRTDDGGVTWTPQAAVGFPDFPYDASLDMIDSWTVVACGTTSTAVRSTDGGQSWSVLFSQNSYMSTDVAFTDTNHGWIAAFSNVYETADVYRTEDGGVTWDSPGGGPFAKGIAAMDVSNVLITGTYGTIYRSTDGGAGWTAVNTPTGFDDINAIDFIDDRNGVVAGAGLKRTIDGGHTWTTQNLGGLGGVADVCFVDSLTGWAAGFNGVSKTQNAGQTWSYTPMGHYVNNVWFVDHNIGFISHRRPPYNGPALHRTTNGGANWQEVWGVDGGPDIGDIYFADNVFGWFAAGTWVLRTQNGGNTWTGYETPMTVGGIWFTSPTQGIAVGSGGAIAVSTDGGVTWTPVPSGVTEDLREVAFTDPLNGYAASQTAILRTTDGGASWFVQARFETLSLRDVDEHGFAGGYLLDKGGLAAILLPEPPSPPTKIEPTLPIFALEQNIPNPFNPATRIRFTVPEASRVRIDVYDVRGKWVCTLVDRVQVAGPGEVAWDGRDRAGNSVASGVYFYRMRAGSFSVARKMVVLR